MHLSTKSTYLFTNVRRHRIANIQGRLVQGRSWRSLRLLIDNERIRRSEEETNESCFGKHIETIGKYNWWMIM